MSIFLPPHSVFVPWSSASGTDRVMASYSPARGGGGGAVTPVDRIKSKVQHTFTPVGVVHSTQKAKDACLKNGLSPAELLNPFTRVHNLGMSFRAASQQFRLDSFRLRLLDSSEFCYVSVEDADAALKREMQLINEQEPLFGMDTAPVRTTEDAVDLIKHTTFDDVMPFMRRFLSALWKTGRCQPHDLLDHPAAIFCVASTSDENPTSSLRNLQGVQGLPTPFQAKQYNPEVPKFCVLIHDNQDPSVADTDPKEILKVIKAHFSPDVCFMATVNSLPEPNASQTDFWSAHFDLHFCDFEPLKARQNMSKPLGSYLSESDLDNIQRVMVKMIGEKLLPFLEQKLNEIQNNVAAHRKGLKNALRSLWRKPRATETPTSNSSVSSECSVPQAMYTFSSMEAQMRYLSDTLFQLGRCSKCSSRPIY